MADGSQSASLDFGQELVVDLFAGGGGASLGISRAYREPDIAINHNPVAVAVHRANHPNTKHYTCDVFEVDPFVATGGRPVGVLWASPDCRHHSKAKGGKPRNKKTRGLAWVVIKWASTCKPRLIHLENVEEFADWGPLLKDGSPCKVRKGFTFRRWVGQLEKLGYKVEWRERIAANAGAPTIRKRLYIIARRDGRAIDWPEATHAKIPTGKLEPWRSAAKCIDFSIEAKSIFDRKKPLAVNTQKRIAKGMWRYVLNCAQPFIVPLRGTSAAHTSTHSIGQPLSTVSAMGTHHALVEPSVAPFITEHANASTQRVFSAQEPLRTQVAQVKGGHFSLVAPTLIQAGHGEGSGANKRRSHGIKDIETPLGTVVASGGGHALTSAHLMHLTHQGERDGHSVREPVRTVTCANRGEQALIATTLIQSGYGEREGQAPRVLDIDAPLGTVVAGGVKHAIASAFFEQANGGFYDGDGRDARDPLSTICASGSNQRLVTAYLIKYYGMGGQWQECDEPMHTVPTKDRMGFVQTVQVSHDTLAPEHRERAKAVADFLHEYLPEHFPEPVDLVLLGGYVLVDITLRMLAPRELARAQGFPDSYIIDRGLFETSPGSDTFEWRPVTKTDQVRLIGNSVCPAESEALIRANARDLINLYQVMEAA